mmetsp:Transcript_20851/g.45323  ORF Transcript_20851/g.45323 Transcript_20851/m.45323 type:complete len:315 (-) Transcript_20851:213-1157(-)
MHAQLPLLGCVGVVSGHQRQATAADMRGRMRAVVALGIARQPNLEYASVQPIGRRRAAAPPGRAPPVGQARLPRRVQRVQHGARRADAAGGGALRRTRRGDAARERVLHPVDSPDSADGRALGRGEAGREDRRTRGGEPKDGRRAQADAQAAPFVRRREPFGDRDGARPFLASGAEREASCAARVHQQRRRDADARRARVRPAAVGAGQRARAALCVPRAGRDVTTAYGDHISTATGDADQSIPLSAAVRTRGNDSPAGRFREARARLHKKYILRYVRTQFFIRASRSVGRESAAFLRDRRNSNGPARRDAPAY